MLGTYKEKPDITWNLLLRTFILHFQANNAKLLPPLLTAYQP